MTQRWFEERFALRRFAPLAGLIALAAGERTVPGVAAATGVALLALLALRVVHDLLRRRELVAARPAPFVALGLAAAACSAALVARPLVLLASFALAWLAERRPRVGLLKYGGLVLALGGPSLLAAAAVYLAFLVHERLHDRSTGEATPLPEAAALAGLPLLWGAPLVAGVVAAALVPLLLIRRWSEAVFALGLLEVLACPRP